MQEKLQDFAQLPAHRVMDSCIVALLSHGVDGGVYGVDGKLLQLQEVFRIFDNANCPSLQNKPKMFFIQACRGDETDRGVDQQDGKHHAPSPGCEESDAGREDLLKMRLPTRSDMICGYACLKGILSSRRIRQTFCSCTLSCRVLWPGRVPGAIKSLVWGAQRYVGVPRPSHW